MDEYENDSFVESVVRQLLHELKRRTMGDSLFKLFLVQNGGKLILQDSRESIEGELEVSRLGDGAILVRFQGRQRTEDEKQARPRSQGEE